MRIRVLVLVFINLGLLSFFVFPVSAATITVNSTADTAIDSDGECTLREAITNANFDADTTGGDCLAGSGTDTISFNIGGGGLQTINLTSELPAISSPVIIDGLTQPGGAFCYTSLLIQISGAANPSGQGIRITNTGSGSSISGLVINGFATGIAITLLTNSDNNHIYCNVIGLNPAGTVAVPNATGIFLTTGSSGNVIGVDGDGTNDANEGNLISGNSNFGIVLTGAATSDNTIAGNRIGTNVFGDTDLGNGWDGIRLQNNPSGNLIGTNGDGTSDALERNIISGNGDYGVIFLLATSANHVAGNYIGTDASGANPIPNRNDGVRMEGDSVNNIIGTNGDGTGDLAERNIISGNGDYGVSFDDPGATGNVVAGNYIGMNSAGNGALANADGGILLTDSSNNNFIGINYDNSAGEAFEGNVISGNTGPGILMNGGGVTGNSISGNYIGTNTAGTAAFGNGNSGILSQGGANNTLIGTNGDGVNDALEGNLISGNSAAGIVLAASNNNVVAGNRIGTNLVGTAAIPNSGVGISIQNGATGNIIGVDIGSAGDANEGNLVSGNTTIGIATDTSSPSNTIAGNRIGTNAGGTASIANSQGIFLGSSNNTICGATALEGNVISGNASDGIEIEGATATNNTVLGNIIGLQAGGTATLANGTSGVRLDTGATNNIIGGTSLATGNIIGGNTTRGVYVTGANTNNNTIRFNYVGTNAGQDTFPNGTNGIEIVATGTGTTTVSNNWIFYHPTTGILLSNAGDLGAAGVSENNCLYQNTAGVNNTTGVNTFFENNWWGAASGPLGAGTGNGDSVSADVDYQAFLTVAPTGCPSIFGVFVDPLAVSAVEGDTVSYTVMLESAPAIGETVTITLTISLGAQPEISAVNPLSMSFDFTSANWNVPQQFDITLNDDLIKRGSNSPQLAALRLGLLGDKASIKMRA